MVCFFVISFALQGCQTPTSRLNQFASLSQFDRSVVNTNGFDHLVFANAGDASSDTLHVYLEGDGSPWRYRVITMRDPTPRDPLMLRLMSKDNSPSVYVGRPCYNGTSQDDGCDPEMWTSARYSTTVVESMTNVIRRLIRIHEKTRVKIIGHSGGGALAMLIAQRLLEVEHVITLAGNLDIDAWTQHHSYLKLFSSLNPARQPPLRKDIKQWHLVGAKDSVVPPNLVKRFISRQPNALGISVAAFGHVCCWESVWPGIARSIATDSRGLLPGKRFKLPE